MCMHSGDIHTYNVYRGSKGRCCGLKWLTDFDKKQKEQKITTGYECCELGLGI